MNRPTTTQALTPSLLDRLIDYDPEQKVEPVMSRSQVIRELRESVRRDLEVLLNTRIRCESRPVEWTLADGTVINYGIPDYSGINLNSEDDQHAFAKQIQKIIMHYETRFKSVKIDVLKNEDSFDRTFRFRIDALLKVEPAVKPVVFDSSLENASRRFMVRNIERG